MATHHFEAHFIREHVSCEFGEDFVSRRFEHVFSARFAARGDGTAANVAFELAPVGCSFKVFQVVDGVRSSKSTSEVARERARQFGGRR
jgi:hypothetical protein